jgi:hypothetical protein
LRVNRQAVKQLFGTDFNASQFTSNDQVRSMLRR